MSKTGRQENIFNKEKCITNSHHRLKTKWIVCSCNPIVSRYECLWKSLVYASEQKQSLRFLCKRLPLKKYYIVLSMLIFFFTNQIKNCKQPIERCLFISVLFWHPRDSFEVKLLNFLAYIYFWRIKAWLLLLVSLYTGIFRKFLCI